MCSQVSDRQNQLPDLTSPTEHFSCHHFGGRRFILKQQLLLRCPQTSSLHVTNSDLLILVMMQGGRKHFSQLEVETWLCNSMRCQYSGSCDGCFLVLFICFLKSCFYHACHHCSYTSEMQGRPLLIFSETKEVLVSVSKYFS